MSFMINIINIIRHDCITLTPHERWFKASAVTHFFHSEIAPAPPSHRVIWKIEARHVLRGYSELHMMISYTITH